jgi:hypothetical protein
MQRRTILAALALLVAVPLTLDAQRQVRVDRSTNANDPDDVPDVTVADVGSGFQVNTGPAAVVWDPGHTATGDYTLQGKFTLQEPSGHVNYYGLIFGGGSLEGSQQNYLYFLIAQNGTFIVKHRAGDEAIHDIVGRTAHEAVVQPDASGKSVNHLEVRVGGSEIAFVVNGTVVHTQAHSGMASRTDGIWGVRINHRIPGVLVEDLGASH